MLTAKQNFLETIAPDGKPDRLVNQFEATKYFRGDPLSAYVQGERSRGMAPAQDRWGVTFVWPENEPFPMPYITEQTKVIRDVCSWREYAKIPDLIAECTAPEMWAEYLEQTASLDRNETLLMAAASTGVFERIHFLMGFEDALMAYLLEPEAMHDLCAAVTEYRLAGFRVLCDILKPDIIISQDDWGSKTSLFLPPEIWREFIKPCYARLYSYLKERGVIIAHHSDSFLEPLVEDMVELGIDVWQGVLPQNDIPRLQRQLAGRMTLMGGIDAGLVDRETATEAEIRSEVRRACETYGPLGHYIPCITYGGPSTLYPANYAIITDEIAAYNAAHYCAT